MSRKRKGLSSTVRIWVKCNAQNTHAAATAAAVTICVCLQYLGKPCIEVVNHPSPVMHLPLNKPGLPVPNGQYMGGLWTVCDCFAQPSPVLPAIPVFDLKKHLLGKMQPLFAALASGADDSSSCLGPLCALLPQLPVLNASLPDLQIPMCLLANLTALLKPHPLMDMASAAGGSGCQPTACEKYRGHGQPGRSCTWRLAICTQSCIVKLVCNTGNSSNLFSRLPRLLAATHPFVSCATAMATRCPSCMPYNRLLCIKQCWLLLHVCCCSVISATPMCTVLTHSATCAEPDTCCQCQLRAVRL